MVYMPDKHRRQAATFVFPSNSGPFACDSGRDFLVLKACLWYGLVL